MDRELLIRVEVSIFLFEERRFFYGFEFLVLCQLSTQRGVCVPTLYFSLLFEGLVTHPNFQMLLHCAEHGFSAVVVCRRFLL